MTKLTTKKTLIVASIVLIAGILASQAFGHMGGGYNNMGNGYHMGGGYGMMNGGHMMNGLSTEDQEKMQEQMNTFFSATKEVRELRSQKQLELNQEYAKTEKDQAKIDTLQKELFDLSAQFEKERFTHMTSMQKLFAGNTTGNFQGMAGGYNNCF